MKRVAWLTDVHLNFLLAPQVQEFLDRLSARQPDAILLGGDIGEAHTVCDYLLQVQAALAVPIYFVLGNHDFYFGSIAGVREQVRRLCGEHPRLHYLSQQEVAELSPHVGLVGHDGWADGRAGDYPRSLVSMHDWKLIAELSGRNKLERLEVLQRLGDEAAGHLRRVLPPALARYRDVVLLTHVPPFREACWHEGRISDDHWSPHFTCVAAGEAILDVMRAHPDNRLTVLCGHTHGEGTTQPLANVQVITGKAHYGAPALTRLLEFD